jgi:hypothetical protein
MRPEGHRWWRRPLATGLGLAVLSAAAVQLDRLVATKVLSSAAASAASRASLALRPA